ncbi:MAG: DUF402 domain-containing protein [Chloroflexota bacterium]
MAERRQIVEIKEKLNGKQQEFLCDVVHQERGWVIVLYHLEQAYQMEEILLPANTLSYGYFWSDRHYNVYHWVSPTGDTLGLYVNICDNTTITLNKITWRDLEIDLLIRPNGYCTILDEDELPSDLSDTQRRLIERTTSLLSADPAALLEEIEHLQTQYK